MPRTSVSQRERKNRELVGQIDRYKVSRLRDGANMDDVALTLGFNNKSTLYRRLENPESLTLRELHSVANVLNINIGTLLGEGVSV